MHPFEARRGCDLPPGYLVDRLRATLLQAPGHRDSGSGLLEMVDSVIDEETLRDLLVQGLTPLPQGEELLAETEAQRIDRDFLARWSARAEQLLHDAVADMPFDPARPLYILTEWEVVGLAHALAALPLAWAKLARRDEPIRLAAPPLPRPHLPVFGAAGPEAAEVVDLACPDVPEGAGALNRRFLHGADGPAARLVEAVAMLMPDRLWEAVARLRGAAGTMPVLVTRLDGLGLSSDVLLTCAAGTAAAEGVARDLAMATCCGMPAWRPLLAVGRDVHYGFSRIAPPSRASLAVPQVVRFADIDTVFAAQGWVRAPFSTAANGDPKRPLLAVWHGADAAAACWSERDTARRVLAVSDGRMADALLARDVAMPI